MRTISLFGIGGIMLLGAGRSGAAEADAPPQAIQQVQVAGARAEQRQRETIASIVIGSAEIMRQGDQTLADVLKRQPGISIEGGAGQGGAIRMRGLGNGYTQILLNGEEVPKGFSLDAIAPELIEKIEIRRSATADLSNQAIAGAINIVLKNRVKAAQRSIGASAARHAGELSPGLTAQLSDSVGALSYTVAANLSRKHGFTPSLEWEEQRGAAGLLERLRRTPHLESGRTDTASIAPRLNWTLDKGDTLAWQNFIEVRQIDNRHVADETALAGPNSEFPHNSARYVANASMLRSDLTWQHQLDNDAKLNIKLGAKRSRRSAEFNFDGQDADWRHAGRHHVASGPAESGVTGGGDYRHPVGEHHALALGWDLSHDRRTEYRHENQFDANDVAAPPIDADYSATIRRLAVYAQDEWDVSPRWSLYLGLRRESLNIASDGNGNPALSTTSAVWSPSLQSRFKLTEQNLLRVALSRTYKAPPLASLVPRRYTSDNNNSPTNPDEQGNPLLRPELAWGMDAAYEHYLPNDGLLSASVFLRRIRDVTQHRLFQQGGAWIETPFNGGDASVHGVELEAKLPLRSLIAQAPAVALRANAARNWSRVAQVAGPDNRLEDQVPLTANLGMDYQLAQTALSVGGGLTFQAGGTTRTASQITFHTSPKRELDLYAAWKASAKAQWRFAATNLLHQQGSEQRSFSDQDGTLRRLTLTQSGTTLRITLEVQL